MTFETQSEHQPRPRLAASGAGRLRIDLVTSKRIRAGLRLGASLLVLGGAAVVSYAMAMGLPLSHDEHQFVAGGWLMGEQRLLPYRDFPFHHLPNLLFLNAALGRITPALLWNARVVSVLLGVGTFGLIFAFARQRHDGARGWFAGTAAVLLLLLSPLFEYTSGRAWNHALPTFLTVGAFLVHLAAARRSHVAWWWVWSGVLLGLAVGSRLTYVSALVPFLAFMLIPPRFGSPRRSVAKFLAGFAVSLIPSLLLALAPRQFLYGNVVHAILNARYRQALGYTSAMSFQGKLAYLAEDVLSDPAQALVFAVFVALVVIAAIRIRRRGRASGREFWFAAGVALFLFLSGFVPTPAWVQYFYAPVPFIALSLVIFATENETQARPIAIAVGILVVTLVTLRWETLAQVRLLAQREAWVPMQVHALGEEVAERTGDGRLLTLAPTVAAEGGLEIYPELVGGSFDWRVARSFSADRRDVYVLMAPEDLERKLAAEPPVGILLGFEAQNEGFSSGEMGGLEWPLDSYADANGYQPEEIRTPIVPGNLRLWTP